MLKKSFIFALISAATPHLFYGNETAQEEDFSEAAETATAPAAKGPFTPFTGRVKKNKVRLRLGPDLDSAIISSLNKDDLFVVKGEMGDFWIVEPNTELPAYVFRSFILDGVVEGNKVNVRLQPDLEAPVLAHLEKGEHVVGKVAESNHKWLEIKAPNTTSLYIAKDFIENIGSADVKKSIESRREIAKELVDLASNQMAEELEKPYDQMNIDTIIRSLKTVVNEYKDVPNQAERAEKALASLQESYLNKKIGFLQQKAVAKESSKKETMLAVNNSSVTDKMRAWESKEKDLYKEWATVRTSFEGKTMQDFYESKRSSAKQLKGIVEAYTAAVHGKPGDYLLRVKGVPAAYLYSTQVNLEELVGREVTVVGLERDNNNFAFPALFVLSAE